MKSPDKSPQSPESNRVIVYILRNRLKELLIADSPGNDVTKKERQKTKAEVLCKIAAILNIDGITPKNANRRLPQIAQELAKVISPEELSQHYCFAKHIPDIQYNTGN
jgi:hypothetical protein